MNKLDALWQYQEAELRLEKLEAQLKTTPSRIRLNKLHAFLSEQQNFINGIQKQIDARKSVLDKLAAQFDELDHKYELELSEVEAMENDEECTSAEMAESRRSLESLLSQVDSARRELYNTLAWIEKATNDYKETYQKAGKAKKEYDSLLTQCEAELSSAQPQIKEAKQTLDNIKQEIDPALMRRYAVIKTHHALPLAKVENNQCGGCNMSLPTSVVKNVAAGTGIIECENCGRILYSCE